MHRSKVKCIQADKALYESKLKLPNQHTMVAKYEIKTFDLNKKIKK